MLKLIASDMDGTLLNDQKEIYPHMAAVVQALYEKGIRFVVASGRQLESLTCYFSSVAAPMTYIAENGGLAYEDNRCVYARSLDPKDVKQITTLMRSLPGAYVIYGTAGGSFVEGAHTQEDWDYLSRFYAKLSPVDDILSLLSKKEICKVTVCDRRGAEKRAWPLLEEKLALRLKVTLSGQDWVDVSGQNVNKGEALRFLQKRYGVKPEECAAIGDYLNDVELLQSCGQSYAMKNAHPQLFSSATQITKDDNNHFGACRVICRLAGIPMPDKR